MKAAEADIDWFRANEDWGLIEACRAAASVAAQFESARPANRGNRSTFHDLIRRLHGVARSAVRG